MKYSIIVLVGLLLGIKSSRQHLRTTDSLQQEVERWMKEKPSGAVAVAVVSPEEIEYFFDGQHVLPDQDTLFEIGSITKGFTGILLADQILSGNVSVHDTLCKLLTDWPGRFAAPACNVTLLELATHSSGLAREPDNMITDPLPYFANYSTEQLYEWLDKAKLTTRGSMVYSNAGVGILGHVLEVKTGKRYEPLLKERVLARLGLGDTTITLSDDQKSRFTQGHGLDGEVVPDLEFDVLRGAGALRSTVSDLAHFIRVATGLEDVPKEVADRLELATHAPERPTVTSGRTLGLCWTSLLLPGNNLMISHNGGTYGFKSYLAWVPEKQIGVVTLASIQSVNNTADDLALRLIKLKMGL